MNNIDIKFIRGSIQKIISVNAYSKFLKIDLALGLIGAYMLKKYSSSLSDWRAMELFLKFLQTECFKGKKRSIINDVSFSECALYIQRFLSTLPFKNKKGTLMSFDLKVISDVDDNGYLSFNDKTFSIYATQEKIEGKPAKDYIIEDEMIEDETNINSEDDSNAITELTDDIAKTDIIKTNEFEGKKNAKHDLLKSEKQVPLQNNLNNNSPFIELFNDLILADSERRKQAKFTWQWLLTLEEYNKIKECLASNMLPTPGRWDNKTVRVLALYLGEFYKREYENNKTPFDQLGVNSSFRNYNKICDLLNIEVYKKDNQTHLHTLYVNGGLPVHYISSKLDNEQSNYFIDGLSKLLEEEDELDISEGEEALVKVSNTSLRESFQKGRGHSIFEYIQAIKTYNKTWDDSDSKSPDFHQFIEKIKEANKKTVERKKFKLFYTLWTYCQESHLKEFHLQPQIRFNPEEDGARHYALSSQRLANLGITAPPAQFSLRIGTEDLRFTRCCNGDYISWNLADRLDLPGLTSNLTPDELLHTDFAVVFDNLNGESFPIRNDINLPFTAGYLQFYTDDDPSMALWNSYKGAKSYIWSGLLFDKTKYHLLSPATIININDHLGWVFFQDYIVFEETRNGKIRTFYNSKGQIYARPSAHSLHKVIDCPCIVQNCLLDGLAKCTIGEEHSNAFIVSSSSIAFDVFRVINDEKINSNPIIKYKCAQEYLDTSSPWNEYNTPNLEQGLYVFRITVACYSTEVKCYVLPDNAEIAFQSNCKPYLIKFRGFENVTLEGIPSTQSDIGIYYRISNDKVDSFTFTIGSDVGSISLETYHPRPKTHVYLYGKELDINNSPILTAYAEEIEVKCISANSCNTYHLYHINQVYNLLWKANTATVRGEDFQLLNQRIPMKLGDSSLEIRVYTQEFQNQFDTSAKMMLLDLKDNRIHTFDRDESGKFKNHGEHDMLLFHSLKDVNVTSVYYAPKFIPKNGQKVANNVKVELRKNRLTEYAEENTKKFLTDYAYQQFEIACEHKIYFAVFDSLLSMCWDARREKFMNTDANRQFKTNILDFLKGYAVFISSNSLEPSISGLRRIAREFLFDWEIIKREVDSTNSQQLLELYEMIINN